MSPEKTIVVAKFKLKQILFRNLVSLYVPYFNWNHLSMTPWDIIRY